MSGKVTRESLATLIAQKKRIPFSSARALVELAIVGMADGIVQDEKLMLSGFGLFQVHNKEARLGRNPKTGKEVLITPRKSVNFKQSKNLTLKDVP